MELMQVAQSTAGLSLFGTALALGLRHGIDWDHIAAITDIASTATTVESGDGPAHRRASFRRLETRALWLAFLYALGHATVVAVLGLTALSFAALLPEWIDPIMERVVGITLLVLGAWVFYSLVGYLRGEQEFQLKSRWMLVFAAVRHAFGHLRARGSGTHHPAPFRVDQYGPRTAYGVGMLHGIGAETGSQVLIIAAVGGAASHDLGVGLMLAFIVGLVASNTFIAVLASTGFVSSVRVRPIYVAIGVVTGVFSLVIGGYFALGLGSELPDLGAVLDALTGTTN